MAIKIIDYNSKEYEQMVNLRMQLLRQPLGLTFDKNELEREQEDILIAAFEEDLILGCCLLTKTAPKTVKLRQMAVLGNLQGKGIGRQMMQFAENVASDYGNNKITMHARKDALGFYEKLGYHKQGDEFMEVTLPHYEMEKNLGV
jgi:predicted GNAT family N-acyltransferase